MRPYSSSTRSVTTRGLAVHRPSTFQGRHDLREPSKPVETMRAPGLAERSAVHGSLDSQINGKKIRASSVRNGTVLRPGLAEKCEIARDREITGHADFLTAAHAHSIHAADHGLVALKNARDHVVEDAHVLAVFSRRACVILGVFTRVSAGAKGARSGARQNDGHSRAIVARLAQCQNHFLSHGSRIAIELVRVVERDPNVVEAVDGLARAIVHGPAFEEYFPRRKSLNEVVIFHLLPPVSASHDSDPVEGLPGDARHVLRLHREWREPLPADGVPRKDREQFFPSSTICSAPGY